MSTSTATSPLLARHGAVEGQGADAGVASHYGDPVREQRLLAEGLAAVDLSHRDVVTVRIPCPLEVSAGVERLENRARGRVEDDRRAVAGQEDLASVWTERRVVVVRRRQ